MEGAVFDACRDCPDTVAGGIEREHGEATGVRKAKFDIGHADTRERSVSSRNQDTPGLVRVFRPLALHVR